MLKDSVGFYTTIVFWSMLEMGLSIIAACLPTLGPIFHDLSAEKLGQRMRSFLALRSPSAGVGKSVSETNILSDIGAGNNVRLETMATGNCVNGRGGGGDMMSVEMTGHILVTKDLRRHSSIEQV